jgi:hypothetical protein
LRTTPPHCIGDDPHERELLADHPLRRRLVLLELFADASEARDVGHPALHLLCDDRCLM